MSLVRTALRAFRNLHTTTTTTPSSLATTSLTPAQASLSAARTVRASLQHPIGGLQNAYTLVNSLRYSQLKHIPSAALHAFESTPLVPFDRPVSARLSSHVLLHGLIRMGKHRDAADLATQMMQSSLRVRSKTLTSFITSMHPRFPTRPLIAPLSRIPSNPKGLSHLLSFSRNPNTRFALRLFAVARNTHHRRSSGMFGTLLALCIINGEIILASLIFGFVCKDWQLRNALQRHFDAEDSDTLPETLEERQLYRHLSREKLKPNREHMASILESIDRILSSSREDKPEHQIRVLAALQALTNLASLLDSGQIPFKDVSTLLRTLYRAPRTPSEVWVDGRPQISHNSGEDKGNISFQEDKVNNRSLVPAHAYFHSVLMRLPRPSSPSHPKVPLDLHACNTLIQYALRHRLSPAHAGMVFQYMSEDGKQDRTNPIPPGVDTLNILIRNGVWMKNEEMVKAAVGAYPVVAGLESLLEMDDIDNAKSASSTEMCTEAPEAHIDPLPLTAGDATSALAPSPTDSAVQATDAPILTLTTTDPTPPCDSSPPTTIPDPSTPSQQAPRSAPPPPSPLTSQASTSIITLLLLTLASTVAHRSTPPTTQELYTLCTLLANPVVLRTPGTLKRVVITLFPCLKPSPKHKETPRDRGNGDAHAYAHYGSYLYTTLLNALLEIGNVDLAKKVWVIAKDAERATWGLSLVTPGVERKGKGKGPAVPWVLPVHAYTTMLMCYSRTYKKPSSSCARAAYNPSCSPSESKHKHRAHALRTGLEIYRTITEKRVKKAVHAEFARVHGHTSGRGNRDWDHDDDDVREHACRRRREEDEETRTSRRAMLRYIEFPRADGPFFKAAVELFVLPHLARPSSSSVVAPDEPLVSGWTRTALAQRIARDMVRAGLPVPPAFQGVCGENGEMGVRGEVERRVYG